MLLYSASYALPSHSSAGTSTRSSEPASELIHITVGVLELEKRRPVDILQQMLEERSSNKMEQFFKSYGASEVASMCFSLITSTPAGASAVSIHWLPSELPILATNTESCIYMHLHLPISASKFQFYILMNEFLLLKVSITAECSPASKECP